MMINTGVLGGTFNPIHNAHLAMAESALSQAALDEIWMMPSHNPPHKQGVMIASEQDRAAMVRLGIEACGNRKIRFSDFELCREGTTYTAQTLQLLRQNFPERRFSFIMGGDSFLQIESWYHPGDILGETQILAFGRNGAPDEVMQQQKRYLEQKYHAKIQLLSMTVMDISSSRIREDICRGIAVNQYVPMAVIRYIKDHHLYQEEY